MSEGVKYIIPINKDVLNQVEVLLAFQTNGPQERKAIAGWTAENTTAGAATLKTLAAEVTRESVCAWVGVHPRGGSVGEELKALDEAGLVVNDRGKLTVTEAGMSAAAQLDPAEAIERAKSGLSNRQVRFFDIIVGAYPEGVSREAIAEQVGIHPRGGSLGEDLGRLVGRGLVERDRGSYRARPFLFAAN